MDDSRCLFTQCLLLRYTKDIRCGKQHRIIESFRLEKSSKMIVSNHKPNAAKPTSKLCAQVPCFHIF